MFLMLMIVVILKHIDIYANLDIGLPHLETKLDSKLEFTLGWQIFIADKMANEWVNYKI